MTQVLAVYADLQFTEVGPEPGFNVILIASVNDLIAVSFEPLPHVLSSLAPSNQCSLWLGQVLVSPSLPSLSLQSHCQMHQDSCSICMSVSIIYSLFCDSPKLFSIVFKTKQFLNNNTKLKIIISKI